MKAVSSHPASVEVSDIAAGRGGLRAGAAAITCAAKELPEFSSGMDRVSNFLGGSPLGVLFRLVVISLLVGVLLHWLGLTPSEIVSQAEAFVRTAWTSLFGSLDRAVDYFLLGAAIVFPLFLVSRLFRASGGGRR